MDQPSTRTATSTPITPPRPPRLAPQGFLDLLEQATDRFARILADGDLDVAVPTCPDWTLADLAGHLGKIHQWATHALVAQDADAHPERPPADPAGLLPWYRESADGLLRVLRNTDPHAPAWSFGPPPGTAAFWYRRQAHEAQIHVWDAATARGESESIECLAALDGIDEVTGMFFPRQVLTGRIRPLHHRLALELSGGGGANRWVLAGDGNGPASADSAPTEATVSGSAEDLLLLLWSRVSLEDDRFHVEGDVSAARAVLSQALTP